MRAAIYARFSSDRQRDASIEDQVRLCEDLIRRHSWAVGPVYVDRAQSGSTTSRSGHRALRDAVSRKQFEVVVAESLDRLMRAGEEAESFGKHCRHARVSIHACAEGHAGRLIMGVEGTTNAVFLDDLADKTRRGLRERVEAGHRPAV